MKGLEVGKLTNYGKNFYINMIQSITSNKLNLDYASIMEYLEKTECSKIRLNWCSQLLEAINKELLRRYGK